MLYGYWGKILRVNLTINEISEQFFDEKDLRKYIGGSGLAVKILNEETDKNTDPLGSNNRLIFMTGPFAGTGITNGGRYQAVTKSPLTGILGEGNSGGTWGTNLKATGYDGIVFEGKSSRPVYLLVKEDKAELKDATSLWGMDTFEFDDAIKNIHGKKVTSLSIGQAGENLVKIASVMNDGYEGRAAGRCGIGAVMGSKNLKAVIVMGNKKVPVANPKKLKETMNKWSKTVFDSTIAFREHGTGVGIFGIEKNGDLPVKNWLEGSYNVQNISGEHMTNTILKKRSFCAQCALGCGRLVEITVGKEKGRLTGGPEYETLAMFGSNLLNDNMETIQRANELCNRYGLDTISTGSVIGLLIEAYETGLIDDKQLDGIKPEWGNEEAIISLVERIALREGIGDLLAEGAKRSAEKIGGIAPNMITEVKGLEFPAHDPRASTSIAIAYATSTRGACHLNAFSADFMHGTPGLGIMEKEDFDRFKSDDRNVNYTIQMQNLMALMDSLPLCKFVIFGLFNDLINLIMDGFRFAVGWEDITVDELLKTGERIFNLKRQYLAKNGISRKDDVLPPRMSNMRGSGSAAEHIPNVPGMLDIYYKQRGWDLYGRPTTEILKKLDIM